MRVDDIMSTTVRTIHLSDPATVASERMRVHSIGHLVVTDHGRIVGIVSPSDMPDLVTEDREFRTVKDVMSSPAVVVDRQMSVAAASRLMHERRVPFLPVVAGEILVGSITLADVARALFQHERQVANVEAAAEWTVPELVR
jgi:CBS domain-containing protein